MAQKTSLMMMVRAMENYAYTKTFCTNQLEKSGASQKEIDSFKIYINNDIEQLKKSSIREMNRVLPSYFEQAIMFDDWESAMAFLESTRTEIKQFNNQ